MRRREFIKVIAGSTAAWSLDASAQQAERVRRVGVLMGYPEGDLQALAGVDALRKGLRMLGWIEGRNVQSILRWAGPDPDKARTFAKELTGMEPDVIVSSTNQVTEILQRETRTIPVVFAFVGDPVGSGFVASLSEPGGNLTGFANFENSIGGKWLGLLREIVPHCQTRGVYLLPECSTQCGIFSCSAKRRDLIGGKVVSDSGKQRDRHRTWRYCICSRTRWQFDCCPPCRNAGKSRSNRQARSPISSTSGL